MSRRKRKNLTEAEVEVERGTAGEQEAPHAPPDPAPSEASSETELEETADSKIERLSREAAEMRDLAQRKQAEFENFRKRMERERADLARYAGADVVREILPVLDNLERAVKSAGGASDPQLREGIAIIHRQLQEALTRLGLSEVESEGRLFDPHVHEAVSQTETEDHPEGAILEVFQKGYVFKDRMLRPAMVSVARPPGEGESGVSEERD
jgi:molecular chaperone GrpE